MKNLWKKFSQAILAWIKSIPTTYRTMFVLGIVMAAFFSISLGMDVCIWPLVFSGFGVPFFRMWFHDDGKFIWQWLVAHLLGGLIPQIFVILHYWWFVW